MEQEFISQKRIKRTTGVVALVVLCVLGYLFFLMRPPATFPTPYQFTITSGETLLDLSAQLSDDGVIRSRRIFEILMISFGGDRRISEGEYYFAKPTSLLDMALRISGKQFGIIRTKVTFPEGFSVQEMSARLATTFPTMDITLFNTLAKPYEGYLFPSTYGFFPHATPDLVVHMMRTTFETQTASLQKQAIQQHTKWSDIVIMASIIEKEAAGDSDRGVVAGILWNRLNSNMALQVDAPFLYLLGKKSSELTRADLVTNSPYNTYTHTGLPPTPINNPGLAALDAALHPVVSPYLYYLHDSSGQIHYAKTFAEHQANIKRYLK